MSAPRAVRRLLGRAPVDTVPGYVLDLYTVAVIGSRVRVTLGAFGVVEFNEDGVATWMTRHSRERLANEVIAVIQRRWGK